MIEYAQRHEPNTLSFEDVTSYLLKLIEVSESESKRLYEKTEQLIKTEEADLTHRLNYNSVVGFRNHPARVFKEEQQGYILPYLYDLSRNGFVQWAEQAERKLHTFKWMGHPQFKIQKILQQFKFPRSVYPYIVTRGRHYKILFETLGGSSLFKGMISIRIEDGKITDLDLSCFENYFWFLYGLANPQDKNILLRDWYPLTVSK